VVQRHVLYLGEINGTQEAASRRSLEVLELAAQPPPKIIAAPSRRARWSADLRG
jgi:hypothetical protein